MSTIWFIRHTESQSNAGMPTVSPGLTMLTCKGNNHAKCIADFFPKPPSLIITSTYKRSRQTAESTRNRFPHVPHEVWDEVREFTYLSESHSYCMNVQDRRPMVESYWESCDPDLNDGEGAESFKDFMKRVFTVLKLLRTRKEELIAVFTHGQFMRAVWWLLHDSPTKMDKASMMQFRNLLTSIPIPNGAILPVDFPSRYESNIGEIIVPHFHETDEEETLGISPVSTDKDYPCFTTIPVTPAFHS